MSQVDPLVRAFPASLVPALRVPVQWGASLLALLALSSPLALASSLQVRALLVWWPRVPAQGGWELRRG